MAGRGAAPRVSRSADGARPPSSSGRPASGGTSARERPFSASNLLATIANARFKTFQVQHEVLGKQPLLAALASDIPWQNLLDCCTLKFFGAGDVLWPQGEHAHELVFVLCGGFLARRLAPSSDPKHAEVVAEKLFKPGSGLLGHPVHNNAALPYQVMAAKFKSIALALPIGKFRSIWRQVSQATRDNVERIARDAEVALVQALDLPIRGEDAVYNGSLWRRGEAIANAAPSTRSVNRKLRSSDADDQTLGQEKGQTQLKHSASTPAVTDAEVTWSTLQVAKPAEYKVNSSVLILHESRSAASLSSSTTTVRPKTQSSSALASDRAKKHAQRRLQSIKLPTAVEAFPRHKRIGMDGATADGEIPSDSLTLEAVEQLLGKPQLFTSNRALDVVPRVRVGRLLEPLKRPAMLGDDVSGWSCSGSRHDRRVLVADRNEPFRDEA